MTRAASAFGVFAAVILALPLIFEVYVGALVTYGEIVPLPPNWAGLVVAMALALAGPAGLLLAWRRGHPLGSAPLVRLRQAELWGIAVAVPAVIALFGWLLVAGSF